MAIKTDIILFATSDSPRLRLRNSWLKRIISLLERKIKSWCGNYSLPLRTVLGSACGTCGKENNILAGKKEL